MSAVVKRSVRTPPRPLIRTFWLLHRAAYRLSGGRFGLQRPEAGGRFGTMRLATVGRRSGQPRTAIIGYYEDGRNLVTLAMNGWGATDPAWWLNLQADPETTVGLADGSRLVRARAAAGAERDRLWARFREFPGWGDDIDALAARRPTKTAVVVLEPREPEAAQVPPSVGLPHAGGVENLGSRALASPVAPPRPGGRGFQVRPRHLWLVPGLVIAVYASTQAERLGIGIVPLLIFTIAPDLTRLLGIGQPHAHGQMAARAVLPFNLMHLPVLPGIILVLGAVGVLGPAWSVGAIAWLGHLVIGLAVGDRVRSRDGFLRPLWDGGPGRTQWPSSSDAGTTSAEGAA